MSPVNDYLPGTEEKDPKKVIMALQQTASTLSDAQDAIDDNTTDIATNTANIATNTANIATNTASIASLTTALAALIPSGTLMLFQQTSAPTGWTKQTTHNDKALRVVSGSASSGGTNAFSTVMAQTLVGSTTLTLAQIPAHSHGVPAVTAISGAIVNVTNGGGATSNTVPTDSQGGGGSHNHTITMAMQYVDIVICSKN